jgi:hypothetical protein
MSANLDCLAPVDILATASGLKRLLVLVVVVVLVVGCLPEARPTRLVG